jgi:hypothetical protein
MWLPKLTGYLRHKNMRFTAKSFSRRSLAEQIKRAEMHRFIFSNDSKVETVLLGMMMEV